MRKVIAGNPVTGADLIGREEEIQKITHYLDMGQHIVLSAPRRFGKTSIMLEILSRKRKENFYTSFIDVFSSPTIEILAENITQAVLENNQLDKVFNKTRHSAIKMFQNTKLKAVIENFEFLLEFSSSQKNPYELLAHSLNFIDGFTSKHNRHMVSGFDEFGDILKLDGKEVVKLFRSKMQLHKNASYIFAGSHESLMNVLFAEKNAPFYRFAKIIEPGYIDKNKFADYYKKILTRYKIPFDKDLVLTLLDFTRGHPYYSQLALQQLIVYNRINNKMPTYSETIEWMLNDEKNYIEKTWEELASSKENIRTVIAIVKYGKNIYSVLKKEHINVGRALKTLKEKGFIFIKEDKSYELSDPLLEHWIRKNIIRI